MSFYTYNSIIKPNFPQEDFFISSQSGRQEYQKGVMCFFFFYYFDISKFIYVNL